MSYCHADEIDDQDLHIDYAKFTAHIDADSIPYLHDAVIDYNKDRFGGSVDFSCAQFQSSASGRKCQH